MRSTVPLRGRRAGSWAGGVEADSHAPSATSNPMRIAGESNLARRGAAQHGLLPIGVFRTDKPSLRLVCQSKEYSLWWHNLKTYENMNKVT